MRSQLLQEVYLLTYFQKQQTSDKLRPQLTKLLQKIYQALTQPNLFEYQPVNEEAKERILKVVTTVYLRIFEKDLKSVWENFINSKDLNLLILELDEFFIDNELYNEIEEQTESNILEIIKREDIQLVCYQWFKPEQ